MIKKILLLILLCGTITHAQQGAALNTTNSQDAILVPFADEAITIAGTPIGFTAATINPTCTDCLPGARRAQRADCVTEAQTGINIRVVTTTTVVSATVGALIPSGTSFTIFGYTAISQFRAIRTASTSVAMYCTYSRTQ